MTDKVPITVKIDSHILERMRNMAYASPELSISKFVQESLAICIDVLEEKNGGPWPERPEGIRLKCGRRVE